MRAAILTLIGATLAACGSESDTFVARASLKDAAGVDFGYVDFSMPKIGGQVTIDIRITTTSTYATAGLHGLHVHDVGKCDPPSFMSAGGHWNPTQAMHGNPAMGAHHSGDLGNIAFGNDRSAVATMKTVEMAVSAGQPNSIIGRAVIVHANQDDLMTQMPPGNAGPRIACGVINVKL